MSKIKPSWTVRHNDGRFFLSFTSSPLSDGTCVKVGQYRNDRIDVMVGGDTIQVRGGRLKTAEPGLKISKKNLSAEAAAALAVLPNRKTRQALAPLLQPFKQTNSHVITGSALSANQKLPVAPKGQVTSFPIGINQLSPEDKPLDTPSFVKKIATGSFQPAKTYLRVDPETGDETYKLCVAGSSGKFDHVVGFMNIDHFQPGNTVHVPLAGIMANGGDESALGSSIHVPVNGNIDPKYGNVELALGITAIQRMAELGAKGIDFTTSWGSAPVHLKYLQKFIGGGKIKPALYLNQDQMGAFEEAIQKSASRGDDSVNLDAFGLKQGELGCILMYLPDGLIQKWKNDPNSPVHLSALSSNRTDSGLIGHTWLLDERGEKQEIDIFTRKSAGLDLVDLFTKDGKTEVATMTMNDYREGNAPGELVDSQGYVYPAWSPMARHGKDVGVPHAFAEYWSIDSGKKFNDRQIRERLLMIGSAISHQKGFGGRLMVEGDTEWKEEIPHYLAGLRPMFNGVLEPAHDPRTSAERLSEFVWRCMNEGHPEDLRAVGSFQIHIDAEDASLALQKAMQTKK